MAGLAGKLGRRCRRHAGALTVASPAPSVIGCGAWLKNAACRLDGAAVAWSALHGDLGDPRACRALSASLEALIDGAVRPPAAIAHDLHPDFFSTRAAIGLATRLGVPAIGVQHHHAHIAVVMAEHAIDEPVIGLALDGVGLGIDGTAWGGELLWVAPSSWRRLGALSPLRLPGGDIAAREPWRMAAAALHAAGRGAEIEPRFAPVVGPVAAKLVRRMLDTQLNSPLTTSAGRWFDAAAGALRLSVRQSAEAEAAIALERAAAAWLADHEAPGPHPGIDPTAPAVLDIRVLLDDLFTAAPSDMGRAAASFHVSLALALADWAAAAAARAQVRLVCLGGGCFFNRVLVEHVTRRLDRHGLRTLMPLAAGCGDSGLALGQAWVAQHSLRSPSPSSHAESAPCA